MKFKNRSLLRVAALSIVAAFSFGIAIRLVSYKEVTETQALSGSWRQANNGGLEFASDSGGAFVMESRQTAISGNRKGAYTVTYELWGYPTSNPAAEQSLLATEELHFIWGNCEIYDNPTEGVYGLISGYPYEINGLDSNNYISFNATVELNSDEVSLDYPLWSYNFDEQNFVYHLDSETTLASNLTAVSFINYGQGDSRNLIRLSYEVLNNGEIARYEQIDLTGAYIVRYPSSESTGASIDGAVNGLYAEQPLGEINTGSIDIAETTITNGFNYVDIYNEVIKYNESDGGIQTVVITEATYNSDSSTINVFYVLRDESGQDTEYTDEFILRNARYSYDSELQRYFITGTTGDFDGIDETTSITLYTNNLDVGSNNYNFVVHFDGNGATSGRMSDDSFTSPDYSVDYELPECSFEKEDYVFFAWSLSNDGMITIEPHQTRNITYSEDGETFYAIWGRTISFDSNGGDGNMDPLVVKEGYNEVPSCDFTRNGYAFKCWAVGSSTGTEVNAGSRVNVNGNYVLYAIWEEVSSGYTYSVIFEGNGATSGTMDTDTFTSDESPYMYLLPACSFERDNYTFSGWSLYEDGNDKHQPNSIIEIESGDTRLYAIWEENSSEYRYSVIFDGNGATGGTMDIDTFTSSEYSYDYELPPCRFEREGYEFSGWSFSDDGLIIQPGETRNITNGETTFFAIWAEQYTITFEANGGSGYMQPITVASGERRTVPGCDFTREGYSFVYWAVNSPTSSMTVYPDDPVTVNQSYVLYAVWEQDGPVQHEGMWYDDESNKLRFYNTDLGGEQEVELEVIVLDFGPNTSLTRADLSAIIYYEDSIWETRSYDMRTFTIGEDSGRQFISGQLDLQDGEGQRAVKLYVETLYNNVMTPGLNYVEGYNQIFYVNDQYDSSVVEFENVEINEITREAILKGYAVDASGETDMHEFAIILTNASVNVDEMYGDGQILTGYWSEIKKTITLNVFNITFNSLEEEPITPETIEEINNGMDKVDLSDDQKQQINDKIDENSDRIGESTGNAISQALEGTTSLMSDNPEFAEKQKEVIVVVVETAIDVETNKGSDIGQGREVDTILPDDAGLNVEQEIREFYERQMQELLGGKETPTRSPSRALTSSYKIDVDISGIKDEKVIDHLDNEISLYGNMMNFIDSSVSHISEAALRIKKCSGEALKVSVKNYVTDVKVSSFREFDKEAADAEFLDNVYRAIMLHMQEQVINTLESEHKDSGNKEKEAVYQEELAAVKDYDTFEIMVTEVLRQKYVALTGDETYTQENLEDFFNDVYWPIFKAWALDEEIPQELKDKGINITLEQLTTTTIEQSSNRARNFTVHSDLQNNEIIFLAAFGGGVVLFISLAAIIPTIINKKRARGLVK